MLATPSLLRGAVVAAAIVATVFPLLHNGSVRTMTQLLMPSGERAKNFRRGSRVFEEEMGYTDEGAYVLDTGATGNSNSGHDYGTKLTPEEKPDLIEYLKTL
jgi:hypothetical protein